MSLQATSASLKIHSLRWYGVGDFGFPFPMLECLHVENEWYMLGVTWETS